MTKRKHQDRMLMAIANLQLLDGHWDAIGEDERREHVREGVWAMRELMGLRNLVAEASKMARPVADVASDHTDHQRDGERR